jgi:hypothetical protein
VRSGASWHLHFELICGRRDKSLRLTCDTDTVDVVGDYAFALNDVVELGPGAVENDGVKADAVEEAKAEGQFVDLIEHGATDFNDGKLGGLRRVRRGGEDAQMAFDLPLGPDRVQQPSNSVLVERNVLDCF